MSLGKILFGCLAAVAVFGVATDSRAQDGPMLVGLGLPSVPPSAVVISNPAAIAPLPTAVHGHGYASRNTYVTKDDLKKLEDELATLKTELLAAVRQRCQPSDCQQPSRESPACQGPGCAKASCAEGGQCSKPAGGQPSLSCGACNTCLPHGCCDFVWMPVGEDPEQVNLTDYRYDPDSKCYVVTVDAPAGLFEEIRVLKQEVDVCCRQNYRLIWARAENSESEEADIASGTDSYTLKLPGCSTQPVVLRIGTLRTGKCDPLGGTAYCVSPCQWPGCALTKPFSDCSITCSGNLCSP